MTYLRKLKFIIHETQCVHEHRNKILCPVLLCLVNNIGYKFVIFFGSSRQKHFNFCCH